MLNRVTFILAAVFALALSILAGCSKTIDLTPGEGAAIRFGAGSMLLVDDGRTVTRSAEFKDSFDQASEDVGAASADCFYVWGSKTVGGSKYSVFNGPKVTLTSLGADAVDPEDDVWEYSPLRFWDTNASQYDFLAISGIASAAPVTCNPASPGHLTASVSHNVIESQADLMAAGGQRSDGSRTTVPLAFDHILSAVSVVIYNDSPLISVTLNAYNFRNVCVQASGIVEQSSNGLAEMTSSEWIPESYTSSRIMGFTAESTTTLSAKTRYPAAEQWDFMIPQSLAPYGDYHPQLYLDYEYDQVNPYTDEMEHNLSQFPINLEEILVKNTDRYITSWEPGKKYSYEIHIRLGGGVYVNVSVTDWEEVLAETPGITLQ